MKLSDVVSHAGLAGYAEVALVFFLLAATDGHAKNFSLRLLAGGRFQLTPLYDVLSAWPVIGKRANEIPLARVKLAMALPGERARYLWSTLQRRHFESLGKAMGLGAEARSLIDEALDAVPSIVDSTATALPRGFPASLANRIFEGMARAARVLAAA